jgi:hypothetical protein
MAQINYNEMDGMQVLWHLLTTEPFFWVILSIGFIAIGFSIWIDKWEQDEYIKHYDDTHHYR